MKFGPGLTAAGALVFLLLHMLAGIALMFVGGVVWAVEGTE